MKADIGAMRLGFGCAAVQKALTLPIAADAAATRKRKTAQ